jgi:hypothetical protein
MDHYAKLCSTVLKAVIANLRACWKKHVHRRRYHQSAARLPRLSGDGRLRKNVRARPAPAPSTSTLTVVAGAEPASPHPGHRSGRKAWSGMATGSGPCLGRRRRGRRENRFEICRARRPDIGPSDYAHNNMSCLPLIADARKA